MENKDSCCEENGKCRDRDHIPSGKCAMQSARIKLTQDENYRVKTFYLDHNIDAKPGQFVMLWVPGIGERPMSLGSGTPVSFTLANIGKVTSAVHQLNKGDIVSFRGPFGHGYELTTAKTIAIVGGGYGSVPLYFLAKEAAKQGKKVVAMIGARKAEDILFEKKIRDVAEVHIATDDGSQGLKGTVVDLMKTELHKHDIGAVYTCGPEKMMYYVAKFCQEKKIACQVSIERHMKCGFGICGSCVIDGVTTCVKGPVFSGEMALSFSEFGKLHRDGTGTKHDF